MSIVTFQADLVRLIEQVRLLSVFNDAENSDLRDLVDNITNQQRQFNHHISDIRVLCNKIRQRVPLYINDMGQRNKHVLHDIVSRITGRLQGSGIGLIHTPSVKTSGLIVDVETTGIQSDAHLISIAWVYVINGVPVETVEYLISPTFNGCMPNDAERIHSITREQLEAQGAPLYDVMKVFAALVSKVDWWATYGGSDRAFLCTALKRVDMEEVGHQLHRLPHADLLMYCRYWLNEYPLNPNHRTLGSAYEIIMGQPLSGQHTAAGDAHATSELFGYLRHHLWGAMEPGPISLEARPGPAYARMWVEQNWRSPHQHVQNDCKREH